LLGRAKDLLPQDLLKRANLLLIDATTGGRQRHFNPLPYCNALKRLRYYDRCGHVAPQSDSSHRLPERIQPLACAARRS
jgi:hypothetical protein